jgi:hypothetical protein
MLLLAVQHEYFSSSEAADAKVQKLSLQHPVALLLKETEPAKIRAYNKFLQLDLMNHNSLKEGRPL